MNAWKFNGGIITQKHKIYNIISFETDNGTLLRSHNTLESSLRCPRFQQ